MIGTGKLWDTPTVIITAVLAVIVTGWLMKMFFDLTPEDGARLYQKKKQRRR
jgi:hypothetical protein